MKTRNAELSGLPGPVLGRAGELVLGEVVEALCADSEPGFASPRQRCRRKLPSRDRLVELVEDLRSVLFPGYFGTQDLTAETMRFQVGSTLDRVSRVLVEQVERGLAYRCTDDPERCRGCDQRALEISDAFLRRLPALRRKLALDVAASYEGDPAATSADEAIFCYPGVLAITNYRLAHELHRLGVPLIPRIITEHAHSTTGIDIHPGATIGERFFIDHGTGVVVGETCVIGDRVRVYQGVTLGAKSLPLDERGRPIKGIPRHPIVEDDVIIYSGATILGRVTVGRGAVIGGNVWLTRSVSPGSHVTQAASRRERFEGGSGI
jgi:serine O-acetyltransferase